MISSFVISQSERILEFFRFCFVGILNTLLGFGLIVFFMVVLNMSPVAANLLGYSAGVSLSYYLNKKFTFKNRNSVNKGFVSFILVFFVAYGMNLAVLIVTLDLLSWSPVVSQGVAMVIYTIVFFLLSKACVFKKPMRD